jgi:hypothetical protein
MKNEGTPGAMKKIQHDAAEAGITKLPGEAHTISEGCWRV